MKEEKVGLLILGGGLSGLSLAYFMKNIDLDVHIVEARNRLGGRILTDYQTGKAPIEKGATWLGKKHTVLNQLMGELAVEFFQQKLGRSAIYEPISTSPHQIVQLPPNDEPSFRIAGGSSSLIDALANKLKPEQIHLSEPVVGIEEVHERLIVTTEERIFDARFVVSTLPPNLLISTINIKPELPSTLTKVARQTHTWMGESIKVAFRFSDPFWMKDPPLPATIFSNVGPIPEMYDHANVEETAFALKGFFNGSYYLVSESERRDLALAQLRKYFGPRVDDWESYVECIWRNEKYTHTNYTSHVLPHQNNAHTAYQTRYLGDKFWIAGAETATQFPGYMEGAVRSALYVGNQLMTVLDGH